MSNVSTKPRKIVITGAPSAGKSSLLQAIKNLALPQVSVVPEAARLLLAAGYPVPRNLSHQHDFQEAILSLQRSLERAVQTNSSKEITHTFLDRGTLDGAAFWLLGAKDFYSTFELSQSVELLSYESAIFMDLPSRSDYDHADSIRFHDYEQSLRIETNLLEIWSRHPNFIRISAETDFQVKIDRALDCALKLIGVERSNTLTGLRGSQDRAAVDRISNQRR